MNIAFMISVVIYACLLVILCIGFSLTHLMEKFPNFAHTANASLGTIFVYTFTKLWGLNPYLAWPFAFLLGGIVGVSLYVLVVWPMQRRGRGGIALSFAMFALSYVLAAFLATYSYWVLKTYGFVTAGFMLRNYDFNLMNYPGIAFVAPLTCVFLVVFLHLFLTRMKFGIAMRATAEDPELATSLGVNVLRVHFISWFLTGAMATLAGAALPLWLPTRIGYYDDLLISVIAGSVLGGLNNIYGAIVGGFILALTQTILPRLLMRIFGMWVANYISLVPIFVIITVLIIKPEGITDILDRRNALGSRNSLKP